MARFIDQHMYPPGRFSLNSLTHPVVLTQYPGVYSLVRFVPVSEHPVLSLLKKPGTRYAGLSVKFPVCNHPPKLLG